MAFWRRTWWRRWLLVVPVVLSTVVATVVTYRTPVIYRSETRLIVEPQRVPERFVSSSVDTRIEDQLMSIMRQVVTRTRLERVINEFNLYEEERRTAIMQDVVQRMRDRDMMIKILPRHQDGDEAVIMVSFQSPNRRTAQRVTERLASVIIDANMGERSRRAEQTHVFLKSQIEEIARQVDEFAAQMEQDRLAHRTSPRSAVLEYEELQNAYRELLAKRQQAYMAARLEHMAIGERMSIIEAARIPERPEGPARSSIILAGAGAGLGVGLLLMLVASMRRSTPSAVSVPAAATE